MTTAGYKHFDRGYKNIEAVSLNGDIELTCLRETHKDDQCAPF